jgi:hypothetical protein
MRYIFITLVTANVLIFTFLFIADQKSNTLKETPNLIDDATDNVADVSLADDVLSVEMDSISEDSLAIHEKNNDDSKLDVTGVKLAEEIAEVSLDEAKDIGRAIVNTEKLSIETLKPSVETLKPNYRCIKIVADKKEWIQDVLSKNNYEVDVNSVLESRPAFKTLYIPALSKSAAESVKKDLVDRKIIADAYVTKILGVYAVSLGVFSKEAGIKALKEKLNRQGVENIKTKQGYRDYETYHSYLKVTDNEHNLIEKSIKNKQIQINIENDEKKCIL